MLLVMNFPLYSPASWLFLRFAFTYFGFNSITCLRLNLKKNDMRCYKIKKKKENLPFPCSAMPEADNTVNEGVDLQVTRKWTDE